MRDTNGERTHPGSCMRTTCECGAVTVDWSLLGTDTTVRCLRCGAEMMHRFTWEDVDLIRSAVVPHATEWDTEDDAETARLHEIAARIAALLPPRP